MRSRSITRPTISALMCAVLAFPVGCTSSSDGSAAPETAQEQEWWNDIPVPEGFTLLSSRVSGADAQWTGSMSARDWPGSDDFLEAYFAELETAGFQKGRLDESGPVGNRTRRNVSFASDTYALQVTITEDDSVVGIVLFADRF